MAAILRLKYYIYFCQKKSSSHSFFKGCHIYFDGRSCSHPLFEQFFQQQYVYFQNKYMLSVVRSFRDTIIISKEYSQPFILSKVLYLVLTLKFAVIHFCLHDFCQCISEHQSLWNKLVIEAAIFSEQHRLNRNESSYLKWLFL